MVIGSLFSGIGGFDLAFRDCGADLSWAVEIDRECRRVLSHHFPETEIFEDVRYIHSSSYLDSLVKIWYLPLGYEYTEEELEMAGKLKKLTAGQAEESVSLYNRGMSIGDVAGYFGVSRQAMWDLLRRRTAMRSQKKYGEENHFHRGGIRADDHAQNITEQAIKKGIIVNPGKCQECGDTGIFKDGRTKIQAHHSDYNKPLEVMWLCQKCHHEWHKVNNPVTKEVLVELPQVNLICGGFP